MKTIQDGINNPHSRTGILFLGGGGDLVFSAHGEASIFDMKPMKRDSVLFILLIEYHLCRTKTLFSTQLN